jgi:hypothetical protein
MQTALLILLGAAIGFAAGGSAMMAIAISLGL